MMRLINALPRGLLVTTAIAFAILVGLGTWQMARLQWKNNLVAEMARTEALPPVPVAEALAKGHADWRSVALPSCPVAPARIIPMHSTMGPVAGYRLLTACPIAPGQPDMLVDLGFTENADSLPGNTAILPVGRLRPADKPSAFAPVNDPAKNDWYSRSTAEMGQALKTQLRADYFLVLDVKASSLAGTAVQQAPMTAPLANRHLEYALTWYGLAVTLLGMVFAFAVQRNRKT